MALLAVIIVVSGAAWYKSYAKNHGGEPSSGGTYTEAFVDASSDWSEPVNELTKAGLFAFDKDGNLQNNLIDSYTLSPDKTEYTFVLKKDVVANEIQTVLEDNLELIGPSTVNSDQQKVVLKLTQPSSSVPLILARPLFDYGPYKVAKKSDKQIVFVRSTKAGAASAFLNKIIIDRYEKDDDVKTLLKKKRVSAVMSDNITGDYSTFDKLNLNYPRYTFLLFNTNKSPFRDKATREKILGTGDLTGISFALTIADSGNIKDAAQKNVNEWNARGAKVTLDVKNADDFKNKATAGREFQAMMVNINYGPELTAFYFWHSSQILATGHNLTGVKSAKIDDLILKSDLTLSVKERWDFITQIHKEVETEAVGKVISQENSIYYVSNEVFHQTPPFPLTEADRFQLMSQWALK